MLWQRDVEEQICMRISHMILEMRELCKALTADGARVGFFSGMDQTMSG